MKSNIEKVYSKLPQKKHNFKKQRVALSLIQDIEIVLGTGFDIKDDASIMITEAKNRFNEEISQAKELLDFELPDAINQTQELINDATNKLNDLGVELPSELSVYIDKLEELKDIRKELASEVDNI